MVMVSGINQYIYMKNDSVQLFFIARRSKLRFDFLKMFRDDCDIDGKSVGISLLQQIIIQHYLQDKCIGYFEKLENRVDNFS